MHFWLFGKLYFTAGGKACKRFANLWQKTNFWPIFLDSVVIVLCRFYRAEAMELIGDHKSQPGGREILEDEGESLPFCKTQWALTRNFCTVQFLRAWKSDQSQGINCKRVRIWKSEMLPQLFSDRVAGCRLLIRQDFNLKPKTLWKDFSIASLRSTIVHTKHSSSIDSTLALLYMAFSLVGTRDVCGSFLQGPKPIP